MNSFVIQVMLCVFIALWGAAMIGMGLVWGNRIWLGLGTAILVFGLPFTRNLRPDRR